MARGDLVAIPGDKVGIEAEAIIAKGDPVYISNAGKVSPATDGTAPTIGVALNAAAVGALCTVLIGAPLVYMEASGTISAGAFVIAATGSKVIGVDVADQDVDENGTATYTFSARFPVGVALDAASADGDLIRVFVMPNIISLTP